ncbi:uncharacterized protein KY384_005589 [Bacidia gigantensis]|uniref:uncharacterized protein n=1 Tax=Bacidia gigantensis TaxID=2732470 RepID=UPI001D044343|nr:uncharacterized protein KY384_005589 [Bacidia gigantensis]KAG8530107.1 hypothetical protein KY384_005589 [Bacidia gigantensis]
MDSENFRSAAHSAIDEIIDYFDSVQDLPVLSEVKPGYLKPLLPDGPPHEGEAWADVQRDIGSKIMPGLTHWQSPNFMAWFPTAVTYPSILGELYSAALSAPGFNWQCSPAMTELETIVLDWMAKLLHLPDCFQSSEKGGGVIQGSASEAVVTVMVAARERYINRACSNLVGEEKCCRETYLRNHLVALGSEQSHSSTAKAAIIAGVKYKAIHTELDDSLAVTGTSFQRMLEECKQEGLEPFFITASIGTTPTCAVDDISAIGTINEAISTDNALWIHIDAAWAGSALVLEEYAHLTKDFELVDSFDMNMHKWLLVNFDSSCLFVKDRRDLTNVLSLTPSYLRTEYTGLVTDYRDWQIPLGRRFRSLKIWFVLRTYGVNGLKAHVRRHIELAERFADWLRGRPDLFNIVVPPAFALTVFTIVTPVLMQGSHGDTPNGTTDTRVAEGLRSADAVPATSYRLREMANDLTKEVYQRINESRKLFLTSGVVNGIYAIRLVSANEHTNEASMRSAFDLIVKITEEVVNPSE